LFYDVFNLFGDSRESLPWDETSRSFGRTLRNAREMQDQNFTVGDAEGEGTTGGGQT
jgi:hypothetical protein